jgi:hypothetical protein
VNFVGRHTSRGSNFGIAEEDNSVWDILTRAGSRLGIAMTSGGPSISLRPRLSLPFQGASDARDSRQLPGDSQYPSPL